MIKEPEWRDVSDEPKALRRERKKLELWHMGLAGTDQGLSEYMGWTEEECQRWMDTGKLPGEK